MRRSMALLLTGALVLGGCAKKAPELPVAAVDRAAACGAVQAASEQEAIGATGRLSAEAQERVIHYALLASARDGRSDTDLVNAVSQRTPAIFDQTVKGKWKTLKPACAAAYPATTRTTPVLPDKPADRTLQCYVLADFMRKALGQPAGRYAEAVVSLGMLSNKLDAKVGSQAKREGLEGDALQDRKARALIAAADLGPPPAVLTACGKATS